MSLVLVDMDGVVADFDAALFVAFKDELDCTPATQRHRFLTDHLSNSAARRRMRDMVEADGWFRDLPLIPHAQEGVDYLSRQGHDVWFCSKPLEASPSCASDKFAWIAEHFPDYVGKLFLAPDKGMVHGDYLIDDAIKAAWTPTASWRPVIFDHPWNRPPSKYALPEAYPQPLRLKGWTEIGALL